MFRSPTPGTDLGGFVVVRDLGQGGMGTVVVARDLRLEREVAIKFLHWGHPGDPEFLRRARREGRALARVDNPHVVRVHAEGAWQGWPFLVMELVRGMPLSDALRRGPLPVDRALRVAEELAEALAAAHAQGIVHRDLKPLNCLLREGDGSLCLLDFGLARGAGTTSHSSSQVVGTVHYMAPEQLRRGRVGPRADVYGFGATLFEALTGRTPHEGEDPRALLHTILYEDAPLLRTLRPDAPRELEVLLARSLARSPEFRPANGTELLAEVRALRAPGGAEGRPPGVAESGPAPAAAPRDPSEALPLLGRTEPYRAALEALADAAAGRGSLLLVEGEAGAGKSRFLREVERAARARGMDVFRCECLEFSGSPYRAFRSMLTVAAAARGAVDAGTAAALCRDDDPGGDTLRSALIWFLGPGPPDTGAFPAHSLLVRAVRAMVRSLLAERPALLVADDLHLLDEGSLDLLVSVLEEAGSWPLAAAAAFRPTGGPRQGVALAQRLPRLAARRGARAFRLGPLSMSAVATLVCRVLRVDEEEACRIAPVLHRRSGGNPLFVVECLRVLERDGAPDGPRGADPMRRRVTSLAIPPRLLEIAIRRIADLPQEEKEALGIVSVEPAGLGVDTVAGCLGIPRLRALRILHYLARERGLLEETGGRYRIPHAEIREAVYGDLLPELRRGYHEEVARVLEAAGSADAEPAALGRHLRLAGREVEAVPRLVEAGRRLLKGAYVAEALERFEEALACAGPGGCVPATLGRAEALSRSGDVEGARAQWQAVAEGEEGRVEALLQLALLERNRGREAEALALLDRAAALPRDDDQSLRLLVYRAQAASRLRRFEEALAALEEAATLAPRASIHSRLRVSHTRGTVLWRQQRFAEAVEEWERTLPLAEESGEMEMASRLLHNLSLACTDLGREEEALVWAERAAERARLLGSEPALASSRLRLVELHLRALRLTEAVAILEALEPDLDRTENLPARAEAAGYRCRLDLARGRPETALIHAARGAEMSRDRPDDRAEFHALAARVHLAGGAPEEALREARAARRAFAEMGREDKSEEAVALAARALRVAGQEGEERDLLRRAGSVRTMLGALGCAAEAADPPSRARWEEEARRLARCEVDRAEIAEWIRADPPGPRA